MNQYIIALLAISLFKQNGHPGTLLDVLLTGRLSLYHSLLKISQEGALGLQLSTLGGPYGSHGTTCKPGPRLFFLCQLVVKGTCKGTGWEKKVKHEWVP